ncbi:MAG: hypothetical protein K2X74_05090 [Acetobacteraceae bacterium]|nr:hypothetical protein [Acetobacteraceae bacterium]
MNTMMFRLALIGSVAALPALAQISPATPDRARPPAATEGSTATNPGGTPGSSVIPPSAGAARGNESRVDSIRPESANQNMNAGQGSNMTGAQGGSMGGAAGMPGGTHAPGMARPGVGTTDMNRSGAATTGATTPGARSTEGGNNAVRVDDGTRLGALEHGANSFTEGQARSRIEAAGFTNLNELRKDDNGIWRGRAMRGGQQVEVGLDYRGNVAPITR